MSKSLPAKGLGASTPSLHPALYGVETAPGSVLTILVCPIPLSRFPHEQLLPELSHELKTPLTGIMGLAQVLQRDTSPMEDREHQYAALIYQRSQQLLVSINDLFDLAQLCTHQFVLQLHPVDLFSVVKTALKVAQNTTAVGLPQAVSVHPSSESTELWMMGDLRRVEQLLTHLISYFAAQGSSGSSLLALRSHDSWISITLRGVLCAESGQGQAHLSWPYPSLEPSAAVMPGRSGTVLKFLLAKQLVQLHGGDVSWSIQASLETEVTVLLPRDLTRATPFTRSGPSQPLFLIYAPLSIEADDLAQALRSQNVLVVVARSHHEVQEKAKILSPSVLVLESCCVETSEWPEIEALLTGQVTLYPIQVVWLRTPPTLADNSLITALDVWSLPLIPEQIAQTLKRLQQRPEQRLHSQPTAIEASKSTQPDLPTQRYSAEAL
jgi:His Kinase A (phospho-acceptor) domain